MADLQRPHTNLPQGVAGMSCFSVLSVKQCSFGARPLLEVFSSLGVCSLCATLPHPVSPLSPSLPLSLTPPCRKMPSKMTHGHLYSLKQYFQRVCTKRLKELGLQRSHTRQTKPSIHFICSLIHYFFLECSLSQLHF